MASIAIRNLEDPLKARHILRAALTEENQPAPDLGEAIHQRFARLGGVEVAEVKREALRTPPSFD